MTEKMKKELESEKKLSVKRNVASIFQDDDFENDLKTFFENYVSDKDFDDLYFAFSHSRIQGFIETFKKLKEVYSFM